MQTDLSHPLYGLGPDDPVRKVLGESLGKLNYYEIHEFKELVHYGYFKERLNEIKELKESINGETKKETSLNIKKTIKLLHINVNNTLEELKILNFLAICFYREGLERKR